MPYDVIPKTASGWPFLEFDNWIKAIPAYTLDLATKLQNGDAAVARAENAATRAETAAATMTVGSWTPLQIASPTDWAAVSGYPLECRKLFGTLVEVRGMMQLKSSWLGTIATLPAGFRPGTNRWLQTTVCTGTNCVLMPLVSPSGTLQFVQSYSSGSVATNMLVSISGIFSIN